jgi:hypothetical protein
VSVCDLAVSGNFGFCNESDCAGAFDTVYHTLGTTSKFVCRGVEPVFLCGYVGNERSIFLADANERADDGVGKWIANGMARLLKEL